jgi:hypothetical protein
MDDDFDPVVPLPTMRPWGVPQTLVQRPRRGENRGHPIVGGEGFTPAGVSNFAQPLSPNEVSRGPGTRVLDPWRRGIVNGTILAAVPTNSVVVLPQSAVQRNLLFIRNISTAANIYINFGNDATAGLSTLLLAPNGFVGFDVVVPQDDVYAIADAANGQLAISSSTVPYSSENLGMAI